MFLRVVQVGFSPHFLTISNLLQTLNSILLTVSQRDVQYLSFNHYLNSLVSFRKNDNVVNGSNFA